MKVLDIALGTWYMFQKFLLNLKIICVARACCAVLWEYDFYGAQLPGVVREWGHCGWGEVSDVGLKSKGQHSSEDRETKEKRLPGTTQHPPISLY